MFDIKKLTDRQIDQIHEFPADSGNYFIGWDDHQAELDAQQAISEGRLREVERLAEEKRQAWVHEEAATAEITRLKGELEAAKDVEWQKGVDYGMKRMSTSNAIDRRLYRQGQFDLAAHALALKEAREVTTLADYVIRELGDGNFDEDSHEAAVLSIHKNTIKAFLASPLSSYQQRAERLEAVAKAAAGHDEDALETALAILEGRGENCAE